MGDNGDRRSLANGCFIFAGFMLVNSKTSASFHREKLGATKMRFQLLAV
jgi:hypothetical protein